MGNPLKAARSTTQSDRPIPPADKQERIRFWIDRGNRILADEGRDDLTWVYHDKSETYSVVSRRDLAADELRRRERIVELAAGGAR